MTPEEIELSAQQVKSFVDKQTPENLASAELQQNDKLALFAWLLKEKGEPNPTAAQIANVLSFPPKVAIGLHGIKTNAAWIRSFSDVATAQKWRCLQEKWNFGYYLGLQFINGRSRENKVRWFRGQYNAEIQDRSSELSDGRPSIVCHSFGTYILGYALLKYDYIRFNRVILCGSILPTNFPWDKILARGQVQCVRNEYSPRDFWAKIVRFLVRGSGPSGVKGFSCQHERLIQEEFQYDHSEYFERGHMNSRWMPFLDKYLPAIEPLTGVQIDSGKPRAPFLVWALLYFLVIVVLLAAILCFSHYRVI